MMRKKSKRISVIPLTGDLSDGSAGAADCMFALRSLHASPPDGVILAVTSPGGSLATAQHLVSEIDLMGRIGCTVTTLVGDQALSAAFYVAMAGTHVVCQPGSVFGSVGALVRHRDFSGVHRRIGLAVEAISGTPLKDMLSPHRAISEEERAALEALVADSTAQFLQHVAERRRLDSADLAPIADGRLITGRQAKDLGLVDGFGCLSEVLETMAERLQLGSPVVEYMQPQPRADGKAMIHRLLGGTGLGWLLDGSASC